MDPSGKKRKGGAERARDQKKAALQADATKCLKIADMFAARGHGASTSAAAASTGSGGEDARQQVDEAAMTGWPIRGGDSGRDGAGGRGRVSLARRGGDSAEEEETAQVEEEEETVQVEEEGTVKGKEEETVQVEEEGTVKGKEEETVQVEEEETVQLEGEETVQVDGEETVQVEEEETAQVEETVKGKEEETVQVEEEGTVKGKEEETAQVEEEETVQRPVAASRNKSLKSHNCSAAASFDANAVSTLKVLGRHAYTARAPRPFLSSGASWSGGASWSARSYCVKSKDALASDKPGKKDDVPSGPTGDECGFKLICFVGINVCLRGGLHAMWLFGLEFICDRQLIPGRRVAMRILRYVLRLVSQLC
ncbi:unnamed protein product [Arctogadus glacialis]